MDIALSTLEKEGAFHCSKWMRHAVLLERKEMESLLEEIGLCFLVPGTGLVSKETAQISKEIFLSRYEDYLEEMLKTPGLPPSPIRNALTVMLSSTLESFYALAVSGDKLVVRARRPVIQLQMYHCFVSKVDHQIHPMAMSSDSFSWGIQISYPQIYEDPYAHEFIKVLHSKDLPDTALYKQIVQWLRDHTKPVSISLAGQKVKAPFRMGKLSRDWTLFHKGLENL